jgi:hypothetical protein
MTINNISIGEWSNPDQIIDRFLSEAKAKPGTVVCGGCEAWSLCYSEGGPLGNVFSAKVRRSTKERDWRILGRMSKRIGAPYEVTPKTIETNADATHYWIWGSAVLTEDEQAVVRKMQGHAD